MTLTPTSVWRRRTKVATVVAWAGSLSASRVGGVRATARVAGMMVNERTPCAGRLPIDVPDRADSGCSGALVDGCTMVTGEASTRTFAQRRMARENEPGARKLAPAGAGRMVEAFDARAPGATGRTLVYGRVLVYGRMLVYGRDRGCLMQGDRRIDGEFVAVDAHAHRDGVRFTGAVAHGDDAPAEWAQALIARWHAWDKDAVPSTPGFCIGRAGSIDPLRSHAAQAVTLHPRLPGHPGMGLAPNGLPGRQSAPDGRRLAASAPGSMAKQVAALP